MRKRHVIGTNAYFTVTGERVEYALDEAKGQMKPTGRVLSPHVRFSSMSLQSAEIFATDVYRRENIVCEIHEVPRAAVEGT